MRKIEMTDISEKLESKLENEYFDILGEEEV